MKPVLVVACNITKPTLNAKGKIIGQHEYPVHLLTTDGRTDTGNGLAWVFAGESVANEIAKAYNEHEYLVGSVEFASTCNAELRSRIDELALALKNLQQNVQRYVANDAPPPWLIDADDHASEVLAKVATQNP